MNAFRWVLHSIKAIHVQERIYIVIFLIRLFILVGVVYRFLTHWEELDGQSPFGIPTQIALIGLVALYFIFLCYTFAAGYTTTSFNETGALESHEPVPAAIVQSWKLWTQIIGDCAFFTAFYALTMKFESDFFLFFLVPILTTIVFMSPRAHRAVCVLTILCLLTSLYLIKWHWGVYDSTAIRAMDHGRLLGNTFAPRAFAFAVASIPVGWVIQNSMRLLERQISFLNIANNIRNCSTQEEVFSKLLSGIQQLGFDRARIWRLVPGRDNLVGYRCIGEHSRAGEINAGSLSIPTNDITGSFVLSQGHPVRFRYGVKSSNALRPRSKGSFIKVNPSHDSLRAQLDKGLVEEWVEIPLYEGEIRLGKVSIDNVHSKSPIADEDMKLLGYLTTVSAIVLEKIRSMQLLVDSQKLYYLILEHLPINIFHKDLLGRFTFVNQFCCQMLGRGISEIMGKTDSDFFPEDLAKKFSGDDATVRASDGVFACRENFQLPDGKQIRIQTVKTKLYDLSKPTKELVGILGFFTPIDEREWAEQQLQSDKRKLLQWFLHDSPKALIRIRDDHIEKIEYYIEHLSAPEEILAYCNKIRMLLDFTLAGFYAYGFLCRSDRYQWDMDAYAVSLQEIVDPVLLVVVPDEPDINFEVQIQPPQLRCYTDRRKVMAMLALMVSNAIKATEIAPKNPRKVAIQVQLCHDTLEIVVEDNGCGFSQADKPRLVEEGWSGFRSSGLGLFIVDGFCKLAGGRLEMESAGGSGAKFQATVSAKSA